MYIEELKSLTRPQVEILEEAGWSVEDIATSQIKDLTRLKGIGKVTARKVIEEAAFLLNEQGLEEAEQLAKERYYQKAPPAKILEDWAAEGLPVEVVALSTAAALARIKGIDESIAMRIISEAQDVLNRQKLYESRTVAASDVASKGASPAFPVAWLSGDEEPPPMSNRIRRNFETAREAYRKANG